MQRHGPLGALLLAIAALVDCGGGERLSGPALQSPLTVAAPPAAPVAASSQSSVLIRLQIPLGGGAQAATRRPRFVSPNTNGIAVAVTAHGSPTLVWSGVADVSGGAGCSTNAGARICTISIVVAPGDYDFTLKTYDTAPVDGSIPPGAKQLALSLVTQQVAAGQGTSIPFVLSGLVGSVTPLGANGVPLAYTSLAADGTTHTLGIGVAAADASGSIITGSAPYASPIPVVLTETGGSGHAALIVNGVNRGSSASLSSPLDTLALQYDGGGTPGYGTAVALDGSMLAVSPLYLSPASASLTSLSGSASTTLSEADSAGVAYSAAASTSSCAGVRFSNATIAGPASGATLSLSIAAPGGTNETCTVEVTDNYGTSQTFLLRLATAGPLSAGSCASGVQFTGIAQSATFTLSDPGGSALAAVSSQPSIVSVALNGGAVTMTAQSSGTATVTLTDAEGNGLVCPVSVTIANGTVQ